METVALIAATGVVVALGGWGAVRSRTRQHAVEQACSEVERVLARLECSATRLDLLSADDSAEHAESRVPSSGPALATTDER